MPTNIIEQQVVHTCRRCGTQRRFMRKDLGMYAGMRLACRGCRGELDDFGYDEHERLVFTKSECDRFEDGPEWARQTPIRYKSLHDAAGEPPADNHGDDPKQWPHSWTPRQKHDAEDD